MKFNYVKCGKDWLGCAVDAIDEKATSVHFMLGIVDSDEPVVGYFDITLKVGTMNARIKAIDFLCSIDFLNEVEIIEQKYDC